jgi:hypothetical protein
MSNLCFEIFVDIVNRYINVGAKKWKKKQYLKPVHVYKLYTTVQSFSKFVIMNGTTEIWNFKSNLKIPAKKTIIKNRYKKTTNYYTWGKDN